MNAITKNHISEDVLRRMTEKAFGKSAEKFSAKELSGGLCSAVYLVEANGEMTVLKIASESGIKVMRHEKMYVPAEAMIMKKLNETLDISMPQLLFYDDSGEFCGVPYFFMSYLRGKPLNLTEGITEAQYHRIKEQLGEITRSIYEIEAPCFGIPLIPESSRKTNAEFVYMLFEWLLLDAREKNIEIPGISAEDLLALISRREKELNGARMPRFIHTDTWNGNVMVENGEFTGLVDYAAVLYGDPLMSHDFHDFGDAPDPYFLKGCGKTDFTDEEKIRIQIYRIWQRLGMVVERGYREYEDAGMYGWVLGEFTKEVEILGKMQ